VLSPDRHGRAPLLCLRTMRVPKTNGRRKRLPDAKFIFLPLMAASYKT
jgi:hypothetical protein